MAAMPRPSLRLPPQATRDYGRDVPDLGAASSGRANELDLRLQHLGGHTITESPLGACQQALVHRIDGATRLCVKNKVLFFNAKEYMIRGKRNFGVGFLIFPL